MTTLHLLLESCGTLRTTTAICAIVARSMVHLSQAASIAFLCSATNTVPAAFIFLIHALWNPLLMLKTLNQGRTSNSAPLAHNDAWLNQHSRAILIGWRANTDHQPVLDCKAAIIYISKYASKPETVSNGYHDALKEFCLHLPQDLPAKNAVQCLFARMADRDISTQEAVHLLLGDKLVGCS